jgi:hypothetical protein
MKSFSQSPQRTQRFFYKKLSFAPFAPLREIINSFSQSPQRTQRFFYKKLSSFGTFARDKVSRLI